MSINHWKILKDAAVWICKDPRNKPHQWIYLVDDAWFHPFDEDQFRIAKMAYETDEKNSGKPFHIAVFKNENIGNTIDWDATAQELLTKASKPRTDSETAGKVDAEKELDGTETGESTEGLNDAEVAKLFCGLATDDGFGICCCSFEYFWEHYAKEINSALNAVFFDINHALLGLSICGGLKTEWGKKFDEVGFNDTAITGQPGLHGWLVHYAIKLGMLGKCATQIRRDHILLISSNFNAKGPSSSGDAISQFQAVFQSLWKSTMRAPPSITLSDDTGLSDFGYTPFLKNRDGRELVRNAFSVFARTFSRMSCWENIRKALLHDMHLEYCKCHWWHAAKDVRKDSLQINIWDTNADLSGVYHLDGRKDPITEASIVRFFKMVLPTLLGACDFTSPINPVNGNVSTGIRPGGAALIAIVDLINSLCKDQSKAGRSKPRVEYIQRSIGVPAKLVITVTADCVKKLAAAYDDPNTDQSEPTKSRQAAKRLSNPLVLQEIYSEFPGNTCPNLNDKNLNGRNFDLNWVKFVDSKITITFPEPEPE